MNRHRQLSDLNRLANFREVADCGNNPSRNRVTTLIWFINKGSFVYLEKLEGLQPIGLMGSRVGGRSPVAGFQLPAAS